MRAAGGIAQYNSLKGGSTVVKYNNSMASEQYQMSHAPKPQPIYSTTFPKYYGTGRN